MGRPRSELNTILKGLCDNVYFQPSENVRMQYPAIVYSLDYIATEYADNDPYSLMDRYAVTVIDRNPDTEIRKEVSRLRYTTFERYFANDGLNHYKFKLYF